jgi:hypothetical protein
MVHDDVFGADSGKFREALAVWRVLAPLREKAGKIDWRKVTEFLEKILPLALALLDLLPQKSADRAARP